MFSERTWLLMAALAIALCLIFPGNVVVLYVGLAVIFVSGGWDISRW